MSIILYMSRQHFICEFKTQRCAGVVAQRFRDTINALILPNGDIIVRGSAKAGVNSSVNYEILYSPYAVLSPIEYDFVDEYLKLYFKSYVVATDGGSSENGGLLPPPLSVINPIITPVIGSVTGVLL